MEIALANAKRVALDCEGVDLGRDGPLTVLTISDMEYSHKKNLIFVVDIQGLGWKVLAPTAPLGKLIEKANIEKVMLDCRSDSDALFHQFGVKLAGVKDLQVWDQVYRILVDEEKPQVDFSKYLENGGGPTVPSMEQALRRVGIVSSKNASAPHRHDSMVWKRRPLKKDCITYAAKDVELIKELDKEQGRAITKKLSEKSSDPSWHRLWKCLDGASKSRCKEYEGLFRDRQPTPIRRAFRKDLDFILEEMPLISESSLLPTDHAKRGSWSKGGGIALEKWIATVNVLNGEPGFVDVSKTFENVMYILQHDRWYTDAGRTEIRRLAEGFHFFTPKQRSRIANPTKLQDSDNDSYWGNNYDYDDPYDS